MVPGSIQLVKADDESILYAVTILKGEYEAGFYEGNEFHAGTYKEFEPELAKACRMPVVAANAPRRYVGAVGRDEAALPPGLVC